MPGSTSGGRSTLTGVQLGQKRWVLLALVCVLIAGTASGRTATAASRYLDPMFLPDVQRDVVYGSAINVDGTVVTLQLDLYTPRGDTATRRPVVVWAHGGSFAFGDKSTTTTWATRMAQRGYVAASINYRLGPDIVTAPVDTPFERQVVENATADMQTAVRWFRANAATLRIDPDRIAVGGTSAGAVMALGVAVNGDSPFPGDHPEFSSAVCTAVSISGANDPLAVGPGDAGAIFHHGTTDTIVPFELAAQTRDAMVGVGLPVGWNPVADEGHDLSAAALASLVTPTVQWLYDRVAMVAYPCSPAVARQSLVPAGSQTAIVGLPGRSAMISLVSEGNALPGFVQAIPCGSPPGASSNLNTDAPGQIRSVLAIVAFDPQGRACLFNQTATHLVADVQGWFASSALDDVPDERLVDTRRSTRPASGSQTAITGRPDSTAVVSLTATDSIGPGYLQVLACGATPGAASNLNVDRAGQTRAGLAFVRFGPDGRACVFVQTSTHVVVDLQAYLADIAFDDVDDRRILDTRQGAMPRSGSTTPIDGRPNGTAMVSLVATDTSGPGYVQVLPCGATPGSYSNLNADAAGQIVAGSAVVQFDGAGRACVFTQNATHLVVDVQGWFVDGSFDDVPDRRVLDTRTR